MIILTLSADDCLNNVRMVLQVTVEYHDKPEMTDYFIELADGIENAHPDIMVTGNPEGMQPRDGAFEVTTGEYVLFSKFKVQFS
ncbi:hypothetical protein Mapa_005880 [Marchantia paleacea]|nr:hypothetical protein Mapa_005880 [Marchantia paleacea]